MFASPPRILFGRNRKLQLDSPAETPMELVTCSSCPLHWPPQQGRDLCWSFLGLLSGPQCLTCPFSSSGVEAVLPSGPSWSQGDSWQCSRNPPFQNLKTLSVTLSSFVTPVVSSQRDRGRGGRVRSTGRSSVSR